MTITDAAKFLEELAEKGVSGHTKHGINQAISRNGRGVSPAAILETIRSPQKAVYQPATETFKLTGPRSDVVLNCARKIVTVTARGHGNTRIPPTA